MALDKRRFAGAMLSGTILTGLLVGSIMMAGVAVAVPAGGIGQMTVTFDEMQGDNMQMYPTVANTSSCSQYPSAVATMESGTIEGMKMYKDMEMPTGDTMRVQITSDGTAEFNGLTQRFTYMYGESATIRNQRVEQSSTGDIENRMSLSGESMTINNGKIGAQAMFIRSISIQGMTMEVKLNPDSDVELGNTECAS